MARRHGNKKRFHFEFGDTVWWCYYGEQYDIDKNGFKRSGRVPKQIFSLPISGIYTADTTAKKMIINNASTNRKKITADSFRNALKLLIYKLDRKDKKNGNTALISKLTELFPESPYYTTNPEWFV